MSKKILVCEDEAQIASLIDAALKMKNYTVDIAEDGQVGLDLFSANKYDLVLTDAMMPNIDGFELVKRIRTINSQVPIIMLTALEDELSELKGLDSGVNDYMSKPFSVSILLKRIEVILERNDTDSKTIKCGNIIIDPDNYSVTMDGEEISLTVKEFEILVYLAKNKNRVTSRDQIIESIWGFDYYGDTRNVDTHMKNIRKKLPTLNIKTIKGIGYNFVEQ